ncbi:hypothetical protein ACFSQT_36855 [Mesorhizobium calcicola]|uniref:Uncharacterized protein n=1 Tax=Mesorhizobium calcicola TaxID=1300310 RepID=A0ABW4WQN7_9HYPH
MGRAASSLQGEPGRQIEIALLYKIAIPRLPPEFLIFPFRGIFATYPR